MTVDQIFFLFFVALCVLIYVVLNKHKSKHLDIAQPDGLGTNETLSNISIEKALAVMSEIDRAILSNASFELLIELILPRFLKLFPYTAVAITQLDAGTTEVPNTTIFTRTQTNIRCSIALDKSVSRELNHNPDGILLENLDERAALKPFLDNGVNNVLMSPIYVEAKLSAVLCFGFSDKDQCSKAIQQLGRDFAGRLSVVLTSSINAKNLFNSKHFDLITSFPNRGYCGELLSLEISRANRYKSRVGILNIQLDGFKKVNEAAGYAAGDNILKQVAERFRPHLRNTDLVARFSDDAFVVILPEISSDVGVSKVAEKLISEISKLYTQGANQFYLNCHIGVSTYPNDGQTVDTLLSKADFAMKRSKVGEFTFHTEEINTAITNQLAIEHDLHKALERDELFVLYQPQIDLRKRKIAGVEVLVRWKHPTKGTISPMEFLPIAEETDLIIRIGAYVRKAAFKQYREWQKREIAPTRIALNISSKELMHRSFIVDFEALLQEFELDPTSIEIEITESLLIDMIDYVKESLEHLRSLGVSVAIDDFGTGYSSLSYIAQLPFDVLKLDRAFVLEIGKSIDKVEIASLIIDMAHHLKKMVCAEGVENKEQLEFLKNCGCETVQGYLLSRPVSAQDFENFSFNWNANSVKNPHELSAIEG